MMLKLLFTLAGVFLLGTGIYHSHKALPSGISYQGKPVPLVDPTLHTDTTEHYPDGTEVRQHEIFDEVFRLIAGAKQFVLLDMFLYNSTKPEGVPHRPLAQQLTDALIARKQALPDIEMIVISDPLNTMYGGTSSDWFEQLRQAGITVVVTDLRPLRDSNPTWSALWRVVFQWFGNNAENGWLGNALGEQPVTLRSYLALPNFKANHRKLLVTDQAEGFRALVTSANPHDGSSRHSNLGVSFSGAAVADVLLSEQAVMAMSGADASVLNPWIDRARALGAKASAGDATPDQGVIRLLTESAIRDQALDMINRAGNGDRIDLAMFYLAHRPVVQSLLSARARGARLRVLLDPNNEAFGHDKSGIPNRQVAMELHRAGVPVRWCNTKGEQCHSKLLILRPAAGNTEVLLGSANFTRRNLDDFNLETNVWISASSATPTARKAVDFVERQWQHGPDAAPVLSLPYEVGADESRLKYWRYRLMEASGLSTF
ncbi:phospholipase D family protein [Marinobacter salinisoli]|uniref:Phospholipase D family protein n=1 Tax=Marinobacter salinisoli TaxID=2769486 RepID=A0ABX7N1Z3_9GAMM|nr:phospholipase D family protein [Marinobacter salinisoli]QSP96393.1 phospholipase D family protein [Marinobacter salinisoli]